MLLDVSHNPLLVLASFAIALMAGFTGLSMTRGLSRLSEAQRKIRVALSAIVLGGGIWSMHFVAMLGMQLPIPFFYDALTTLISALIAILIVGLGLIILHFRQRTSRTITLAGLVLGAGILGMHYTGMAGMQACRATYSASGILLAVSTSLTLSTLAVWIAYGERTRRNVVLGTICFAAAVVALHYIAVENTGFVETATPDGVELVLGNEALGFVVTLAAFAICGGFLLSGATFYPATPVPAVEVGTAKAEAAPSEPSPQPKRPEPKLAGVPYEKDGRTLFTELGKVAAFRAEGHYTIVYRQNERVFCQWSISEAEKRLAGTRFMRTHRSYLVNPDFVSGFERNKDSGVLFFEKVDSLGKVPVSRSRLSEVRETLGL